jgi:hypothetical protein
MHKLMTRGTVRPEGQAGPVEIERGMQVIAADDLELGKVAALLVDGTDEIGGLLLSKLPEMAGYWVVQMSLVEGVEQGQVRLRMLGVESSHLPAWRADLEDEG